ncbi:hypothetical protein FTF68_24425, partial [Salmonella enterica]|nr:hypothetical protein [Salmonella enterica]EGA9924264.1 hypothetical protein [Salmonella enterica subsp. enterica serovar Saintpaul]EGR9572819.1 hypothetical protein [Salmonella enterica subsp. enterica serovar Grumpensis]ELW3003141.1 hypothetical protein [Salmonella enterica]
MDNFYDLFMASPLLLVVLFFVAVLAGFIDSIVGGGGLLTIPALIAGGCVGFYDGFFGPAAGSFYALTFVTLCGYNLAKSTAHGKVLNATSNVGGQLLFIIGG